MIEAMACGTLLSRGVSEIVEGGITDFIVESEAEQ
jgi:hypothetical protein